MPIDAENKLIPFPVTDRTSSKTTCNDEGGRVWGDIIDFEEISKRNSVQPAVQTYVTGSVKRILTKDGDSAVLIGIEVLDDETLLLQSLNFILSSDFEKAKIFLQELDRRSPDNEIVLIFSKISELLLKHKQNYFREIDFETAQKYFETQIQRISTYLLCWVRDFISSDLINREYSFYYLSSATRLFFELYNIGFSYGFLELDLDKFRKIKDLEASQDKQAYLNECRSFLVEVSEFLKSF